MKKHTILLNICRLVTKYLGIKATVQKRKSAVCAKLKSEGKSAVKVAGLAWPLTFLVQLSSLI